MKRTTTKSYALRIDGPLVKPLQELKKRNRRSLNAEINAALEAWLALAAGQSATAQIDSGSDEGSPGLATAKAPRVKKPAPLESILKSQC